MAAILTVGKTGSQDTGICPCCGHSSRRVNGFVYMFGVPVAVYYVHWTLGHVPEHGAHFDLIMGFWGEGARDEDRLSVSLEYRVDHGASGFMVIDARPRPFAQAVIALGDDRLGELFPGLCGGAEPSHQVQ